MNNENNDNSVTAPSWRIFKIGLQWQALTINYCRNGSCSGEPYRDPTTVKLLPKSTTCRVETLHPLRGRNGWRPPRFVQVTGWVDDPGGSLASIFYVVLRSVNRVPTSTSKTAYLSSKPFSDEFSRCTAASSLVEAVCLEPCWNSSAVSSTIFTKGLFRKNRLPFSVPIRLNRFRATIPRYVIRIICSWSATGGCVTALSQLQLRLVDEIDANRFWKRLGWENLMV